MAAAKNPPRGEKHYAAKIKKEDVFLIRTLDMRAEKLRERLKNINDKALAIKFEVAETSIAYRKRKADCVKWSWKLDINDVNNICEIEKERKEIVKELKNLTYKKLGEMVGLTPAGAWRVAKRDKWIHINA